jgi:hypothetical protein
VFEVLGDSLAESEIDSVGVVDEETQGIGPRFLEGDEIDLGVQLGEPLLNVLLGGVGHA